MFLLWSLFVNIYLVMLIVLHVAGTSHCSGFAAELSYVTDMFIVLHRAIRSHFVRLCRSTYLFPCFGPWTFLTLFLIWIYSFRTLPLQFFVRFFGFSLCPTFGGCCPGVHMEVTHSVKDELNLSCGCALVNHPSAFASASVSTRG